MSNDAIFFLVVCSIENHNAKEVSNRPAVKREPRYNSSNLNVNVNINV